MENSFVRIFKTNKYFDLQEFKQNPIKTVVDQEDFHFSTNSAKIIDYKLSVNYAKGSSSRLAE